ncbi:MAG: hypothetical protein QXE57_05060 [Nitrososphaerales archaeon]
MKKTLSISADEEIIKEIENLVVERRREQIKNGEIVLETVSSVANRGFSLWLALAKWLDPFDDKDWQQAVEWAKQYAEKKRVKS